MTLRRRAIRADEPRADRVAIAKKQQDSALTAILTWIPTEVIATYKVVMGLIPEDNNAWRLWVTIVVFIIVTPAWTGYSTKDKDEKIAWRQVILAPFAFACWVAAIQPDVMLQIFGSWQPWMGSVVLALGTILLPPFDFILKKCGVPQN